MGYLIYNYLFLGNKYGMMSNHHGYYDNYSQPFYYLHNGLLVLASAFLIIIFLVYVNKKFSSSSDAMRILDNRLSNGDISINEYQSIKKVIKGNR